MFLPCLQDAGQTSINISTKAFENMDIGMYALEVGNEIRLF
jgi:hypothetical protein